jgi:hypothetical protein
MRGSSAVPTASEAEENEEGLPLAVPCQMPSTDTTSSSVAIASTPAIAIHVLRLSITETRGYTALRGTAAEPSAF